MAIKTLHITNSYHAASGGIRTFYHALIEVANRRNRFVRLVVPGPETVVEEVWEFGRIYHVAAPHVPVIDSRYRWMLPHVYAHGRGSPPTISSCTISFTSGSFARVCATSREGRRLFRTKTLRKSARGALKRAWKGPFEARFVSYGSRRERMLNAES